MARRSLGATFQRENKKKKYNQPLTQKTKDRVKSRGGSESSQSSGGSSRNNYTGGTGGGGYGAQTRRQIDQGAPKRSSGSESRSGYIAPQHARNNNTAASRRGGIGADTRRGIDNGSFVRPLRQRQADNNSGALFQRRKTNNINSNTNIHQYSDWRKTQRENEKERTAHDRLMEAASRRVNESRRNADRQFRTIGEQLPGRQNYRQHNLERSFEKNLETSEAKWHGTSRKSGYYSAGGSLIGGRKYYVKDEKDNWRETSYESWKKQNDHDQKEEDKYRKLAATDERYKNDPRANWDDYGAGERIADTVSGAFSSHVRNIQYGLNDNNSVNHRAMSSVEQAQDNLKIAAARASGGEKAARAMADKLAKQREDEKKQRFKDKIEGLNEIDRKASAGEAKMQAAQHGTKGLAKFGLETLGTVTGMGVDIGIGAVTGTGAIPSMVVGAAGGSARQADKDEYGRSKTMMALRSGGVDAAEKQQEINRRYGAVSGAIEGLSEKIFAIGAPMQKLVGKGVITGDRLASKMASRLANSKSGRNLVSAITKAGMSMTGEGLEEVVSGVLNPIAEKMIVDKDKDLDWGQIMSDSLHDALIGGVVGGLFGGAEIYSQKKQGAFIRDKASEEEMIREGLRSDEGTKAHQLARDMQVNIDKGKESTDFEVRDLNESLNETMTEEYKKVEAAKKQSDEELEKEFGEDAVSRQKNNKVSEEYMFRQAVRQAAEERGQETDENELDEDTINVEAVKHYENVVDNATTKMQEKLQANFIANAEEGEDISEADELPKLDKEYGEAVQAIANISVGEAELNDYALFSETDPIARETLQEVLGVDLPEGNAATRDALIKLNMENRRNTIELGLNENVIAEVRQQLGDKGHEEFTNAMKHHNVSHDNYAVAYDVFKYYYDAGVKGTEEELPYDQVPVPHIARDVIPRKFMEEAYRAGHRAGKTQQEVNEKNVRKATQKKEGRFTDSTSQKFRNSLDEKDAEHLETITDILKGLSDVWKVNIELTDPSNISNGYYKDGTIYINANISDILLDTFTHEFTHHMEKLAPKEWKAYADFVAQKMNEKKAGSFEKAINRRMELYGRSEKTRLSSRDDARREVIADSTRALFEDKNFPKELAQHDVSLARKIADILKKIIAQIKQVVKANNLREAQRQEFSALWNNLVTLQELRDRFIAAAKAQTENETSGTGGTQYELKDFSFDKQTALNNMKTIVSMNNVKNLTGNEFEKGEVDLVTQVENYFNSIGNNAHSDIIGDIELKRAGAKSSLGHGMGRNKAIAYAAVAEVIEKGKIIDAQRNWKGNSYDTVVFAAPIRIGNEDYYQGVIVQRDKIADKQAFYLHEVAIIKKGASAFKTAAPQKGSTRGANPPSLINLLQRLNHVNALSTNDITTNEGQFSLRERDEAYMKAVRSGNMREAQRMVDEAAKKAGWRTVHAFHGTLNYGFNVFDKSKARVEGNSGAGFYFSTNQDDSEGHYSDVEVADNVNKIQSLAYVIYEEGEWDGKDVDSYEEAEEIARSEIEKEPGTYDVYLKYENPYIRNYRNSTNLYDVIEDNFDDSVIDRDEYDDEDDYEEALMYEREEQFYDAIYKAVYNAYSSLEDNYEVIDAPDLSDLVSEILSVTAEGSLTWDDIENILNDSSDTLLLRDDSIAAEWGAAELTRAIIENFGFDAIEDKEVDSKFGQLSREMLGGTEHIIVFSPEQIKESDPVTYDDNGNVIPLSERFNPESDDIRYKVKEDSEGNELSQGQQEYFKDSKIRDDEGRLMVMYHGTANEFTVFDFSQGGINGTAEGFGIYLADTSEISDKYGGRIIKGYANITRPAYFNKRDLTEEEIINLIKATAYKEAEETAEDYDGDIEEAVKDTWISNYANTYEQNIDDSCAEVADSIIRLNNNDMDIVQEIMNGMGIRDYPDAIDFYDILTEQTGIDGFVTEWDNSELGEKHEIVLAFRSDQVKDIDNQNPTEDPDIRYSVREDLEDDLDKILDNTFKAAEGELLIGDTSDFLVNVLGANPYKVTMPARKAYQAMVTEEQAKKDGRYRKGKKTEDHYHGLGKEKLIEVLKAAEEPLVAFVAPPEWGTDKRRKDRIGIVTNEKDADDNYIVVIQEVNSKGQIDKKRVDVNKTITTYGKDYIEGQINDALAEDRILFMDKKRSHIVAGGTSFQLARRRNFDFKDNINNFWAEVNYEEWKKNNKGQYSLRESLEDYDVENAKLREKVDKLRAQMKLSHGTILQDKDSARIARELLDMPGYMGGLKLNDINKQLKNIYALLAKDETMEEGLSEAMELARDIVNHTAEHNDDAEDEFNRLNEYLRTTPIYIDEGHYGDVAGNKAEYNSWRKKMFGKLKIVKMDYPGASSVDNMMMELRELFPGIISDNGSYNEYDQFNQVLAYRDQLERNIDTYFDAEWPWGKEMTASVASIIFDELEAVQPGKSFADRKKEEKERAVAKEKSKADERIRKLREEKKEAVAKTKEHYREMIKKVREEKNASTEQKLRMRMEREHARNEARKERAYRRRLRGSIERDAKQLSEMLLKPTDKKHIPHGYNQAIAELLNSLDFESVYTDAWIRKYGEPSQRVMNLQALREQYQKIMHEGSPNIETSDYMSQLIEALSYKVDGHRLADLDTRTLSEVRTVVKAIKHQIQNINSTFSEGLSKKVSEYGDAIISELSEMEDQKITGGYVGRARDFMMTGNAKPIDFFDRMGSPLQEVFNEIVKGEDAHIRNVKQSIEFIQKVKDQIGGKKPFESWSGEKAKAQVFTLSDGDEIELTPAQVMSLYALNKREQARKHIFASGVVVAPVSRKVKNKLKKKLFGDQLMKTHVHVSYADVVRIVNTLTAEQRMVADKFLGFLNNQCAQWGNETSMKLYGYEAFKDSNYFPIKSSEMFLNESTQEKGDAVSKLKNTGFTKSVKDFADNPIVIDDFFRVCTGHINTMSMYNAFVPAITDFERVYNYNDRSNRGIESSVKQMINKKYGNAVNKYISTLLQDLNTQYNKDQEGLTIADELLRRWKAVKIGANIRVLLQQPTAITRAQVYIDYKYLAKGIADVKIDTGKKVRQRMWDTVPIAFWKHLGFAQTDIAPDMMDILMGNESLMQKVAFDMYGWADDITWTRIFAAVEAETRDIYPELKEGSEEWNEHINERFRYIVDRTQVVDSTLHRSDIMRKKGWFTKSVTSFMAEPTTQVNMWLTMIKNARDAYANGDKAEAARLITRFGQNYAVSMVTLSVMAALWSAARETWTGDDDDDERMKGMTFTEKWLKVYAVDDLVQNVNILNQIPYVKDVMSVIQGYDVERVDMEMIGGAMQSAKRFAEYFTKNGDVKFSWQKLLADAATDMAELFGVPAGNAKRDLMAMYKVALNMTIGSEYAHFKQDSMELNPSNNKQKFIDYYLDSLEKGKKDTSGVIKKFLKDNDITEEDIEKTIQRRLNDEVNKAIDDKQPDKMKAIVKKYKKNYNYTSTDVTKKVRRYFSDELKGAIEKGDLDKLDRIVSDQKKYGMAKADIESTVSYWTNRNYKTAIEKGDTKKMDAYDKLLKRSGMSKKDIYMNRGNMYIGYYDMLIYNAGSDKERHRLAREVAHMFPDMTGENYILNFVGNTKSKTNLDNWRQRKWTKAQISRLRYRS